MDFPTKKIERNNRKKNLRSIKMSIFHLKLTV